MGKKVYTGFADKEAQMRKIVQYASDAITKAYARRVKDEDGTEFTTWFGTGDKEHVKDVIHRMNYAMINGNIEISYTTGGDCADGETNAIAYVPDHGWNQADVHQARVSNFNLTVCPRLLKIMALLGTDHQSQVGTFLHEVSHLLGGTDDIVDPDNNETAYGAQAAKRLAKNHHDLAINNAENYGFYISSFISR